MSAATLLGQSQQKCPKELTLPPYSPTLLQLGVGALLVGVLRLLLLVVAPVVVVLPSPGSVAVLL